MAPNLWCTFCVVYNTLIFNTVILSLQCWDDVGSRHGRSNLLTSTKMRAVVVIVGIDLRVVPQWHHLANNSKVLLHAMSTWHSEPPGGLCLDFARMSDVRWRHSAAWIIYFWSLRYELDERLQPTAMLDLVGLLSSAQVEYKPVDLQSYEARSVASFSTTLAFPSMYRRLKSTRLIQCYERKLDSQQINLCARSAMVP